MSRKPYWDDPFALEFNSVISGTGRQKDRPYVVLQDTHFYAEAGGQLADQGWIGSSRVVDVQEIEGITHHYLDAAGPDAEFAAGQPVSARIDRAIRLDRMQQHTGQHVLSAGLIEVLKVPTVSFHMGEEICTIDTDRESYTEAELDAVEDRVNEIIKENRPIRSLYPDLAQLEALSLRKDAQVSKNIRVVEVQGFDRSPCCGTHCTSTGQLGVIHIRRWDRVRQKARISFLVGQRAVRDHRRKTKTILSATAMLSIQETQLEDRIQSLLLRQRELVRELTARDEELGGFRAERLLATAQPHSGRRFIETRLDLPPEVAKGIGLLLSNIPDIVSFLWIDTGEVFLSTGTDTGLDSGKLLNTLVKAVGGRGGGQPTFAQGRVDTAAIGKVLAALRERLVSQ